MRKLNFISVILLSTTLFFFNCKSQQIEETPKDLSSIGRLNSALPDFCKQLDINPNAKVVELKFGINDKVLEQSAMLKSRSTITMDLNNATTIKFVTSGGDTLTAMTIPLADSPNIMTCIAECKGESFSSVADFSFNETNKTMSYTIPQDASSALCGKQKISSSWGSQWMDCMKGGLGSHIGVIITVAGVAGGVGCVPCAGVAAFYTGVLSVGCMPTVKLIPVK